MSFDPFSPDDAGDESAVYRAKPAGRPILARAFVAAGALVLLGAAALVAVLVS